jgi:hypothetical protein
MTPTEVASLAAAPCCPLPELLPAPPDAPPDSVQAVHVPLGGAHGAGRFMVLDAEDWRHVSRTWGCRWFLTMRPGGREYVVGTPPKRLRGDWPSVMLARLITSARRGELVQHRDGDALNLRRANLRLLDHEAARQWRRAQMALA